MLATVLAAHLFQQTQPERKASLTEDIHIHEAVESKILGVSRSIRVWLPPQYDSKKKGGYPVVYMLDGQNVFDGAISFIPNQEWRADETGQAMVESGLIPPIVIVALDNGGLKRADEYLPTRAKLGNDEMGGQADTYADYLIKEVKPFVANKYNVTDSSEQTALVGSSFGGVAAFHIGTTHPSEFGLLGVMSPSFWWDNNRLIEQAKGWKTKPNVRIWMDTGGAEGPMMVLTARTMRDVLVETKFVLGKDFVYYEEQRAEHNEVAWARRLPLCFQFFFKG